jgi:hypothetical protein
MNSHSMHRWIFDLPGFRNILGKGSRNYIVVIRRAHLARALTYSGEWCNRRAASAIDPLIDG